MARIDLRLRKSILLFGFGSALILFGGLYHAGHERAELQRELARCRKKNETAVALVQNADFLLLQSMQVAELDLRCHLDRMDHRYSMVLYP